MVDVGACNDVVFSLHAHYACILTVYYCTSFVKAFLNRRGEERRGEGKMRTRKAGEGRDASGMTGCRLHV